MWPSSTRRPWWAWQRWWVWGAVAAASLASLPLAAGPAAAATESWTRAPYDHLGAWVDTSDWTGSSPTFGLAQVDAIAARGVRTLYLQGARSTGAAPLDPTRQRVLIDRAHQRGLAVVTWFLPNHLDPAADRARALALATQLPVDGLALDIESDAVADPALRSARAVQLAAEVDAALAGPVGAIVPAPVGLEINSWYWPGFPWAELGAHTDAWLPMTYWTYRPEGSEWAEPQRYVSENVRRLRSLAGEPYARVHVLGDAGLSRPVPPAEIDAMWRGAVEQGAVGASVYDVSLTRAELWDALARMSFSGLLAGPDVVAVTGSDRQLWVWDSADRAWSGLGGVLIDSPAIAVGDQDVYFFAVGTDHGVWVRSLDRGWVRYGPEGTYCVGVSAVVSRSVLSVSCKGSDGAAWVTQSAEPPNGLPQVAAWRSLGGVVKHGVSVADVSTGVDVPQLLYAAVGSDDGVWGHRGSGWYPVGGQCTGAVSLSRSADALGCRGTDEALWVFTGGWRGFGGQVVDKPGVTVHRDGRVQAYVTGTDSGGIWTGSGSGWSRLSGVSTYGVAAVTLAD